MTPTPPNGVDVPFIANAQADALFAQAASATEGADCTFYQQGEIALMQNGDVKPINEHHYDWFGTGAKFEIDLGTLADPVTPEGHSVGEPGSRFAQGRLRSW